MKKLDNIKALIAALEARKFQERALLLGTLVVLLAYLWLTFGFDPMNAAQADLERRITVMETQILEQTNRQQSIQANYSDDPNAFARQRREELQEATMLVDNRLNELYGQLILPRQMAIVLTSILQRETSLKLISMENQPPRSLITATAGAAVPLVGEAVSGVDANVGLQVYRHGIRMDFEGDFLETIDYLRSLEALDTNFFWETLSFQVLDYPNARISVNIFTLSTQESFIGV